MKKYIFAAFLFSQPGYANLDLYVDENNNMYGVSQNCAVPLGITASEYRQFCCGCYTGSRHFSECFPAVPLRADSSQRESKLNQDLADWIESDLKSQNPVTPASSPSRGLKRKDLGHLDLVVDVNFEGNQDVHEIPLSEKKELQNKLLLRKSPRLSKNKTVD